jgi:LysR family transcriptional regulator, transcriptional activator of nhaA
MVAGMEWLNYHHLRYFWTVAKEGSLKKAAEALRVSPPSISSQIGELEDVLGEKLFRRSGRSNVLTDAGQVALRYADEIFTLGRELVNAVKQRPTAQALRLYVGVADSFPKLVTNEILKPVFAMPQAVHVICREGKLEDLLGQLAAHRLDIVLADEPASSSTKVRTFNHPLGESATSFCASGKLVAALKKGFPQSLHDAPALLPSDNTALRREVEAWFRVLGVRPRVLAEFEDLALMKVMAAEGRGFIVLPSVVAEEAVRRYGFRVVGTTEACRVQFHAITAERRLAHPAVVVVTEHARNHLFPLEH